MCCVALDIAMLTLIIKGIMYYSQVEVWKENIVALAACFMKDTANVLTGMGGFSSGINFGFVFFMGIVALLIVVAMVGQIVTKLVEEKYYTVRSQPDDSGMELSELKTSLRSRRVVNESGESIYQSRRVNLENY